MRMHTIDRLADVDHPDVLAVPQEVVAAQVGVHKTAERERERERGRGRERLRRRVFKRIRKKNVE